jgi:hypothetical protein
VIMMLTYVRPALPVPPRTFHQHFAQLPTRCDAVPRPLLLLRSPVSPPHCSLFLSAKPTFLAFQLIRYFPPE